MRAPIALVLLVGACAPSEPTGGLTAALVFQERVEPGVKRQSLDARIGALLTRLRIEALDGEAVLASVELHSMPSDGQLQLVPTGGEWLLEDVASGSDRTVRAAAYRGATRLYFGQKDGIEVLPSVVTDAGEIVLQPDDIRVPDLDQTPPSAVGGLAVWSAPEGDALQVSFDPSPEPDTAGYIMTFTATAAEAPNLERGRQVALDEDVGSGFIVRRVLGAMPRTPSTVSGLVEGVRYVVAVYAFDPDAAGLPLNWSAPSVGEATPVDSWAPSMPSAVGAWDQGSPIEIRFVSPGDDGDAGTPERYEVRVSTTSSVVADPTLFESLPVVATPAAQVAGTPIAFTRTRTELGVPATGPIYIGARAIDHAGNVGAIGVGVSTTTQAPTIDQVVPAIAITGDTLVVQGRYFQTSGVVQLQTGTSTRVFDLPVSSWTDTQIEVDVPDDLISGVLVVRRSDRYADGAFLPVLQRRAGEVDADGTPFEMLGVGLLAQSSTAALYREANGTAPYDAAIERIYDDQNEGVAHALQQGANRSTAIGGTASFALDRFLFVAADRSSPPSTTMTMATIRGAKNAPQAQRLPLGVDLGGDFGDVEHVSALFLDGVVPGPAPAMVAFTVNGRVVTGMTRDATTTAFAQFLPVTGTTAVASGVGLAKTIFSHQAVMFVRRDVGTGPALSLYYNGNTNNSTPYAEAFELLTALPSPVGPNLEVRSTLRIVEGGALEGFVVGYEQLVPNGDTKIRLLALVGNFPARLGYAPFLPDPTLRLEDLGTIVWLGAPWLVALASRQVGQRRVLMYAEVPLEVLIEEPTVDDGPPLVPPVVLATSTGNPRARLGCKPYLSIVCPIAWIGDDEGVLFVRR